MKEQTPSEYVEETLRGANYMGTLMREPQILLCLAAQVVADKHHAAAAPPAAECAEDEQILLLLGSSSHRFRIGPDYFDWRAAQIASWSVPVACCIKCRGEERGCGGLSERGTTHSKCWPEAWE